MYETTIWCSECSQAFIAVTLGSIPAVGTLIQCKHCTNTIELAADNAIVHEITN